MPRKTTSQWEFGDLFTPANTRRVLSVGELTTRIKGLLEQQVGTVWVSGEVTNFRAQSSGHCYFSIKDAGAALGCVLFRGTSVAAEVRGSLKDGQKVILQGEVTVYEPRGQYQLVVRAVELEGIGVLQAAFERLKQRLSAQGWFDPGRKRPIPRFPGRVGLVTSPTGAALRDVLHVAERRYAGLEWILAPCRVQGQGAAEEVAAAIGLLNRWSASPSGRSLDAILVTRGGGSLEDLWAFNEEVVARAIFESALPVISAIGHEIDFTIADFVADLRAATPSAAAEILTAAYVDSREIVARQAQRLRRTVSAVFEGWAERIEGWSVRLRRAHPRRRLNDQSQRLDDLELALLRRGREVVRGWRQRVESAAARLGAARPDRRIDRERERLDERRSRMARASRDGLRSARDGLERLDLRLGLLSPERVLARGYSITLDVETGRVLRRAEDTASGRELRTRLHSGDVISVVARARPAADAGARESQETP